MARPRSVEFSIATKEVVYSRGVCAECGAGYDPNDPFEVHHIIWVAYGLEMGVPHAVLSCLANAELLHRSCHQHLHNLYDKPPESDVKRVMKSVPKQHKLALR